MKKWTVTVTCNYVTLENKYTAYAEEDPINNIIDEYFEELADDLYNDYSSRITEDYDEFVEDVQIYSEPAEEGEDYAIIYDERDIIRPWLVEVYSDERCSDSYAAYSRCSCSDELENIISNSDKIMGYVIDAHVGEWSSEFSDDEEYEEWESTIGAHVSEVSEDDMEDPHYMKWFNSLEVIYDERNEIE